MPKPSPKLLLSLAAGALLAAGAGGLLLNNHIAARQQAAVEQARALLRQGNDEEALRVLAACVDLGTFRYDELSELALDARVAKADRLSREGKFPEARALVAQALLICPPDEAHRGKLDRSAALTNRLEGELLSSKGEHIAAAGLFAKAGERQLQFDALIAAQNWIDASALLSKTGVPGKENSELYLKAAKAALIAKDGPSAYTLLRNARKPREAFELLVEYQFLQYAPTFVQDIDDKVYVGETYERLGRLKEALPYYELGKAWTKMAKVFERQGKGAKAGDLLDEKGLPREAAPYYERARDWESAYLAWSKVGDAENRLRAGREWLSYSVKGSLNGLGVRILTKLSAEEDRKALEAHFDSLSDEGMDVPDELRRQTLVMMLVDMKRHDKAALLYEKLGEREKAREQWVLAGREDKVLASDIQALRTALDHRRLSAAVDLLTREQSAARQKALDDTLLELSREEGMDTIATQMFFLLKRWDQLQEHLRMREHWLVASQVASAGVDKLKAAQTLIEFATQAKDPRVRLFACQLIPIADRDATFHAQVRTVLEQARAAEAPDLILGAHLLAGRRNDGQDELLSLAETWAAKPERRGRVSHVLDLLKLHELSPRSVSAQDKRSMKVLSRIDALERADAVVHSRGLVFAGLTGSNHYAGPLYRGMKAKVTVRNDGAMPVNGFKLTLFQRGLGEMDRPFRKAMHCHAWEAEEQQWIAARELDGVAVAPGETKAFDILIEQALPFAYLGIAITEVN